MLTLSQHLANRSIQSLLAWADLLDPNHSWDELVESDPSISSAQLAEFMLTAYDDEDTVAWINRKA